MGVVFILKSGAVKFDRCHDDRLRQVHLFVKLPGVDGPLESIDPSHASVSGQHDSHGGVTLPV